MARIPFLATSAVLLLAPAFVQAQDGGGQAAPAPTPTPTSQPIERVQGVPDDFTLQPQADTVRRNRTEPTIQPLPQPSAAPRQVAPTPTPTPTPSPTLATPAATPSPRIAFPAQQVEEASPQAPSPAQRSNETVDEQEPQAEPEAPITAASDDAEDIALPTDLIPAEGIAPVALDSAETSWGWLGWLMAGLLAIAALGPGALWWLRRNGEVGFTVEKIEPYRPPEVPPAPEPAQSRPEPARTPTAPTRPATPNPSGLVHASRPASPANTGGFVTSTISTRPRQPQPAQASQAPRRYTSPDGRIVTSLSPNRREGD